jgi:two-component system sensor histidine kinase KdpD
MWIARDPREETLKIGRFPLDARGTPEHIAPLMRKPDNLVPPVAAGIGGYAVALGLVILSTLAGTFVEARWGSSAVDLLYLPAVLATAVFAGLGPALLAAIAAALTYNFFFTAPYHTFRIHSPADIVTVAVLFVVALVTSKLAASIRRQAQIASAHAARNATIAGFARRLLGCATVDDIADIASAELGNLFDCNVLLVSHDTEPRILSGRPAGLRLTAGDIGAAALAMESGEATGRGVDRAIPTEWQFHPVRSDRSVIAALGLARDDGLPPLPPGRLDLLQNLVDQLALALERARLESATREFASMRQRDRTRLTILASIRHDLGPRVEALAGAARQLRRSATADKPAAAIVASETLKLERYVTNLLELEPDAEQQPVEAGGVSIDLFQRAVSKDGREVHLTPKEFAVLAELAKHPGRVLTHAHLLRAAWGPAQENQTEYLRVAIRALRQKLERNPTEPELIVNEPAVGYRLNSGS